MRTTVDLPDDTFRQLKALAAQRGVSLKHVLRAAVEKELARAPGRARRRRSFQPMESKEPGTLNLTNAEIEDLLT